MTKPRKFPDGAWRVKDFENYAVIDNDGALKGYLIIRESDDSLLAWAPKAGLAREWCHRLEMIGHDITEQEFLELLSEMHARY